MSTALSLTVGWVSNSPPLAEPSCVGMGIIDPETGNEIGGLGDSDTGVGAWSTRSTGTLLSGEILKVWNVSMKCWRKDLFTHLVGFSELESISIDSGEGARDKWRREDNFPLKDPVILCMRLVSDGFLLEMMIVGWEICCVLYKFALPTVNTSDGSWYQTLYEPEPVEHEAQSHTWIKVC